LTPSGRIGKEEGRTWGGGCVVDDRGSPMA
jgi:hypothetical protein